MHTSSKRNNRLLSILLMVMAIVLLLGGLGFTLAGKRTSFVTKKASNTTYTNASTKTFLDNSTLEYPIDYKIGSVARQISAYTYSTTAQYLAYSVSFRYVTVTASTGAVTNANKAVNNINIIPFIDRDWYFDQNHSILYRRSALQATSSTKKAMTTILTGVEFFDNTNGVNYSGCKLQIILTPTTYSSSAIPTNGVTVYNVSTNVNYAIGSFRTPIYVRNNSSSAQGLTFTVNAGWYNSSDTAVSGLPRNKIKLNLSNNYFTGYNGGNNTESNSSLYTSSYAPSGNANANEITDSDALQYGGSYTYRCNVLAGEIVPIIDSIEIINVNWTGNGESDYAGTHVKISLGSCSLTTLSSPKTSLTGGTTYNVTNGATVLPIDLTGVTSGCTLERSAVYSTLADTTLSVSYNYYIAYWVQYISGNSNDSTNTYDIVAGEYAVLPVTAGVSVAKRQGQAWSDNNYKQSLTKGRTVSLFDTVTIASTMKVNGTSVTVNSSLATALKNIKVSSSTNTYTDSFGISGRIVPSSYTPRCYLIIKPTITTNSSATTATDFASEVLISQSAMSISTSAVPYTVAIKNTSTLVYSSAIITLTGININSFTLGLNTGWSWNGNQGQLTYSGAIKPGQTVVAVGSATGSSSVINYGTASMTTSSSETIDNVVVIDETQTKGVYMQNATTGINYTGDANSSTKKIHIINTSSNMYYIRVMIAPKYMKAGATGTGTLTFTATDYTKLSGAHTYYYNKILLPGQEIELGGVTITANSSNTGTSVIYNPTVAPSVVSTTSFAVPSGWDASSMSKVQSFYRIVFQK